MKPKTDLDIALRKYITKRILDSDMYESKHMLEVEFANIHGSEFDLHGKRIRQPDAKTGLLCENFKRVAKS